MIFGIGTDLVLVERIAEKVKSHSDFMAMVFSEKEISYCNGQAYPAQHFAARFAAKESLLKATGKGLQLDFNLSKIEIANDELGKPFVILHPDLIHKINIIVGFPNWKIDLSLSHTTTVATAFVVISTS